MKHLIGRVPGEFQIRLKSGRFDELMGAHLDMWKNLWRRFDVHIDPGQPRYVNLLMLLRLNMFHILQTVSLHSIGLGSDQSSGAPEQQALDEIQKELRGLGLAVR